ncbi:Uncharacterized conserved protein YndB, AHSA1/START domain [Micromonospora pattaloongensis]|uniref:Uncharacterized conserved protein YndB, AHSA1/START domain n=1 Tax=Micromonospora pattaloongensis TaxID=405436 RepID=A0A1H3M307_9ACTN|nr:SRPBCC domain-containing protein [Micromonospora pattaloongensis]SDY70405.1 Uncharacterized conserved protein YndB, AHSA1/START domain [Micromonospora pattaloongensis]
MAEIRIALDLAHPPELAWRALTEPALLACWFTSLELEPRIGAPVRLRPRGLAGFDAPVEGEVTRVEPLHVLAMRWRGPQLHTHVTWQLTPAGAGCRLVVTQRGFLGVRGSERRAALTRTYRTLFGGRLPAVLDRVVAGAPPEPPPIVAAAPRPPADAARAGARRRGSFALVLTAVLAGATGAAVAGLFPPRIDPATVRPGPAPAPSTPPVIVPSHVAAPAPQRPVPPAPRPSPAVRRTTAAPPAPTPPPTARLRDPAPSLTAEYRPVAAQLLGYSGAVTVRNDGTAPARSWTATITLPPLAVVARADLAFRQTGTTVTFTGTPLAADASTSFGFTVALDPTALLGPKAPLTCSVEGVACRGM